MTAPMSPPEAMRARRRRRVRTVVVVLALIGGVGFAVFNNLNRVNIPENAVTDAEHFKYGSIGSDATGIPYWIWRAMPEVCPDKLPGGYPGLGLIQEVGMDRPIGFSKRRVGPFDRVGPNCAFCHTASVRTTRDGERRTYLTAPAHQLDLLGYFTFLFDCGADPRFTVDNVMAAIDGMTNLGVVERMLYRRAIEPTRAALREQATKIDWVRTRPPWGPGRVDTFNPYKTLVFAMDMSRDDTIGTADFMTIWDEAAREGLWLHWDGNNNSIDERNLSAATGAGATPENLDLARIERVKRWIWTIKPPAYPYPIDAEQARQGKVIYDDKCAECHDGHGARIGQVVPLELIGTDPERAAAFDPDMARRMNTIGTGYPWQFRHFRPTHGYVNQLLDGVWLRAPYLHNGSVPTLRDLLTAPAERPARFYKGDDVYDPAKVGFVSDVPGEGGKAFFVFETSARGNHATGHTYGVNLPDREKDALIEYLKTL
jgi:mono/diheme cytochrome c family protein